MKRIRRYFASVQFSIVQMKSTLAAWEQPDTGSIYKLHDNLLKLKTHLAKYFKHPLNQI